MTDTITGSPNDGQLNPGVEPVSQSVAAFLTIADHDYGVGERQRIESITYHPFSLNTPTESGYPFSYLEVKFSYGVTRLFPLDAIEWFQLA